MKRAFLFHAEQTRRTFFVTNSTSRRGEKTRTNEDEHSDENEQNQRAETDEEENFRRRRLTFTVACLSGWAIGAPVH